MNFSIIFILAITIVSVIAIPKVKETAPKQKAEAKTTPGAKTAPEAVKKTAYLNSESTDVEHMRGFIRVPEKLTGIDLGCILAAITDLASCLSSNSEMKNSQNYEDNVSQVNTSILQCIINLAGKIIPCINVESLMDIEHSQESDESYSHSVESYPGHHERWGMHQKMSQL